MNMFPATRIERIAIMQEALEELDRACFSMREALRESNDEIHQVFFHPVLDRINLIVANAQEGFTVALADDLTNARSAVRRIRLPDIDPDLGAQTPALKILRGERGNLIESLDTALEAADQLGMHPRDGKSSLIVPRQNVAEQLIRLDERLRAVQDAVADLQKTAAVEDASNENLHNEQKELVDFHIRTIGLEVQSARFEAKSNFKNLQLYDVDISSLSRSIEIMYEVSNDLRYTVQNLGHVMARAVRSSGLSVVHAAERSWQGLKTVVRWVGRKNITNHSEYNKKKSNDFGPDNRLRDFDQELIKLEDEADILKSQGGFSEARLLYERALHKYGKIYGDEHPNIVNILHNLADLMREMNEITEALSLYEHTLAIREKIFGPEHPAIASSLSAIATTRLQQGDLDGAQQLYERALAIRTKILGHEHLETANSFNDLASLLHERGDLQGSRQLYERAIDIRMKMLGPEHLDLAYSFDGLAKLLRQQGDFQAAESLLEKSLTIRKKILGPTHPDAIKSFNILANLLGARGNLIGNTSFFARHSDMK